MIGGLMATPAMVLVGCWLKTSCVATFGLTRMLLESVWATPAVAVHEAEIDQLGLVVRQAAEGRDAIDERHRGDALQSRGSRRARETVTVLVLSLVMTLS